MRWFRCLAIFSAILTLFLADTGAAKALRFLTTADVPSTTLWGAMSNGFRLSLRLNSTSAKAGDPVLATIDLENLGPDREVVLGCNMEEWYDIGIVDGQRRAIPHNRIGPVDCYSTSSFYLFKHNAVLEITLRIDDKFQISEAGSYSVTATSILHPPYQFHADASGKQLYDSPVLASLVSNAMAISIGATAPPIDRTSDPVTPKPTPTVGVDTPSRPKADTPPGT